MVWIASIVAVHGWNESVPARMYTNTHAIPEGVRLGRLTGYLWLRDDLPTTMPSAPLRSPIKSIIRVLLIIVILYYYYRANIRSFILKGFTLFILIILLSF